MSVGLIHETLATHLRRSGYSDELVSTCAASYRGLNPWTRLALDVNHRASSGLMSGLAKLSSKMQGLLETRLDVDPCEIFTDRKYLKDWPCSLSSIFLQHVETSEWTDIRDLLYVCFSGLDTLLNHGPEVVNEFFQSTQDVLCSDVMALLLFSNDRLLNDMARTRVMTAKTLRLWKDGRLDLAFSAALSVLPYLNQVFDASVQEESVIRDTFDILLISAIWSNLDDQTEDLQRLLNCPAMRDFQMDGSHICALNEDGRYLHEDSLNITIRQFSRPNQIWSQIHDRDCRYYGSAHTLITHWCRIAFTSDAVSDAIFELFTKANVEVNAKCYKDIIPIEMVLDTTLLTWTLYHPSLRLPFKTGSALLLRKVQTLLDHECGPPSVEKLESALKRAERLRRYFVLHYYVPGTTRYYLSDSLWKSGPAHSPSSVRVMDERELDPLRDTIKVLKDAKKSNRAR